MHPSTSRVAIHYAPFLVKKPAPHIPSGDSGLQKLDAVMRLRIHDIDSSGREQVSSDDERCKEKS